jgi:hypothetical protein
MHLLENYSLQTGFKIGKPFILERYFPLTVDKYITLQVNSKYPSKCYDYWDDVVAILNPILNKQGIVIVQIGGKDDPALPGCYYTCGQTSIGQAAHIIHHGLLNLSVDSFSTHFASYFKKKIVCLYSNNYISAVKPFWTEDENCVLLEPDRPEGHKPSFSAFENPKSINRIKPEVIAKSVCDLLGIEFTYPFETIDVGINYQNRTIESVPNHVVDISRLGIDSLILRADLFYNDMMIANQLQVCPCSIVTKSPISDQLLQSFRFGIRDVLYIIDKDHSPKFVKKMQELAIRFTLASWMSEEEINAIKIDYIDYGIIHRQTFELKEDRKDLKNIPDETLYYKSKKYILSEAKIFLSEAAWRENKPINNFDDNFQPIINTPEFWKESLNFRLLKKVDNK